MDTVTVYNMALAHLGSQVTISNVTEKSGEARICNTFFQAALEATLRDYRIEETRRYKTLSLVAADPTDEWAYSYDYPNDCLFIRRILSGIKNDTNDTRVAYERAQSSSGRMLIYTDAASPQIEYTVKVTNLSLLPADFILALGMRLAGYIAPVVAKGVRALQLYQMHIGKAVSNSNNEAQPSQQPQSDHVRSRE